MCNPFLKMTGNKKSPVCNNWRPPEQAKSLAVSLWHNLTEIKPRVPGIPGYGANLFFAGIFRGKVVCLIDFSGRSIVFCFDSGKSLPWEDPAAFWMGGVYARLQTAVTACVDFRGTPDCNRVSSADICERSVMVRCGPDSVDGGWDAANE